jgi:hypothetical protein
MPQRQGREHKPAQPQGKGSTSVGAPDWRAARQTVPAGKSEQHALLTGSARQGGSGNERAKYILHLQKAIGNRAVTRMVAASQRTASTATASPRTAPTRMTGATKTPTAGRGAPASQNTTAPPPHQAAASLAQQQLRNAAAEIHASLTALPPLTLPQAKSAVTRPLLNAIQESARKGHEHLAASTASAVLASAATAEQKAEAVSAAEAQSVEKVRGHVQSSRQMVSAAVEHHTTAVAETERSARQKLTSHHDQASARAQDLVNKRQDAITALGSEQAARIQESGDHAAQKATSALASASAGARSQVTGGGGDERAAGHSEVADRLGNDAASQMENASAETEDRLKAHASEAAETVTAHIADGAAAVGGLAPSLQASIGETMQRAGDGLSRVSQQSVAALHTGSDHVHQQLSTAESKAVELTKDEAAKHREQISAAGVQAATAMRQNSEKALQSAQQQLSKEAERIASSQVDGKTADAVTPTLQAQIAKAYAGAADQVSGTGQGVSGHLATAAQEGADALGRVPGQMASGLAKVSQAAVTDMGRVSGEAGKALSQGANATMAASDRALSQTAGHLDRDVAQARTGFSAATVALENSLNGAVSETNVKSTDALSGLHGRISQGNERVDSFVAQKGPTVQRSILGDIGGWFADQFRDLWNMLKDPAFWVGLVVTLVLTPFLGPGALVVAGLVAGAVSGIEQNLAEGKKWYDSHNILRDAAIGLVAGFAMALGVAAITALGLEGAAATVAVMALSAVIGIVVNLVNGQRWDKGLLANLLLAWLFRRFGGAKTPVEDLPPEQGEIPSKPTPKPSEIVPEGMSPKLVSLRGALIDPRAIAQFDSMFARLGGNSAKMETIVEGFPNLEQRLIQDWEAANPTPRGAALGEVAPLKTQAEVLRTEIEAFRAANPKVTGIASRLAALDGEIGRLNGMLQGRIEATPDGVQGTRNNIGGIEAELRTAQKANTVTGLGTKFSLDGVANKVEVDVVADNGETWIDTKNVPPFGLESSDWVGGTGKQGLRTQATEMVRAAGQNPLPSGKTPRVVFDFPKGVSAEVAAELQKIGARARGTVVPSSPGALVPVGPPREDDREKKQ